MVNGIDSGATSAIKKSSANLVETPSNGDVSINPELLTF
jgi:hypothetical protein